MDVHNVSDVRHIEVNEVDGSIVHGPSYLEVEIGITRLKIYKISGSGQIPVELIQAGGAIHKLINYI
jgi:diphthamide biosynthesis methyltransferase